MFIEEIIERDPITWSISIASMHLSLYKYQVNMRIQTIN